MFEEMEQVTNNNQNEKTFMIEGITNKEIGKKIKSFSKTFLKLEIVLLIICAFFSLIGFLNMADYMEGGYALLYLLIMALVFFLIFVGAYFGFLITSGFGALVEDINFIKNVQIKKNDTTKKPKE